MRQIKLSELQPGMVTDQDIFTPGGRLLLPAGTTLTARHIRMLEARDITHTTVASPDPPRVAAGAAAPLSAQQEQQLFKRLQHNDAGHPFIAELARLYRLRAADAGR